MTRKEELLKLVKEEDVFLVTKIIDNIVDLEENLEEIKKLPFIQYDKVNKFKQRQLPASKLYTSLLQQYNIALKTFQGLISDNNEGEDSPLRAYLKKLMESD